MLQTARNPQSKSFLRELEFFITLINDDKARDYFLEKLSLVSAKRNDSSVNQTGERDIKSEILAYLNQRGYTQTANVWARALSMDKNDINELLQTLQIKLLEAGIEGVLEIHLQDREINSPHIQFVGIEANRAEVIIAQTLAELKYETSIQSALSKKNFQPYYKINTKARYPKQNDLKKQIEYYKVIERNKNSDEEIQKIIERFDESIIRLRNKAKRVKSQEVIQNTFEARLQAVKNSRETSFINLREQRTERRLRRMRRLRR